MNIDELLNLMDEILEDASSLPFTGGKRVVDCDKLRDVIDDVRLNLPSEVKQAKAIVNDRADIVAGARTEATNIISKAEKKAELVASQQEIVRIAEQKATSILTEAQQQSRDMRITISDYCENILRKTEDTLAKSTGEVKNVRQKLHKKGAPN